MQVTSPLQSQNKMGKKESRSEMMSIWRNFKDKKKTTIPSQSRKTTPQFSEGDTKEGWIVKGLRKVSFTSMNRACSTSVPSTPRSGGSLLVSLPH